MMQSINIVTIVTSRPRTKANTVTLAQVLVQAALGRGWVIATTTSKLLAVLVGSLSKLDMFTAKLYANHSALRYYVAQYNNPSIHMAT